MKIILATLLTFLSISTAYANDFEANYTQDLVKYYPTLKANTKNIWPGFEISNKHPLLIAFTPERTYALDFTPKSSDWQQQNIGDTPVALSLKNLGLASFSLSAEQPYFKVDDQSTIVLNPGEMFSDRVKDFIANTALLVEFYYFAYEVSDSPYAKLKQALINNDVAYKGYLQTDNMTLLYLQSQLIKSYLTSSDVEVLKDYVALAVSRTKLLESNTATYEQLRAPFVNVYIHTKALTKNDAEYAKLAIENFELETQPQEDFIKYLTKVGAGSYEDMLDFVAAGVDLGLDRLNPAWKEAVESQNTAPDAILQQFFHLTDSEIASRLAKVKASLGYDELNQKIKAVLDPFTAKISELEKAYQAEQGMELIISVPKALNSSYEANRSGGESYEIDSNTTLWNSDDLKVSFEQANINIAFSKFAIVYDHDVEIYNKVLTSKLNQDSTVVADGVEMTLDKFVASGAATFHTLIIKSGDKTVAIENSKALCKLELQDGKLKLSFTP